MNMYMKNNVNICNKHVYKYCKRK